MNFGEELVCEEVGVLDFIFVEVDVVLLFGE